jgi:hypothetical protein
MSLAWHVEAMRRQKKLPALRTLLLRARAATPQTVGQMRAALSVLSAQYGIPMRKVAKRPKGARRGE